MAIVGDAYIVVHAVTTQFEKEVEQALSKMRPKFDSMGEDLGKRLNNGFRRSSRGMFDGFIRETEQARIKFNSLIRMGYYVGPAIAGAIAAISSLLSGLFAIGAAAGAAIPAVVALGGALSALGQVAIVARLAFSGVSKALQEQTKAATGAANKQKQLAKEYQRYSDALYEANRRLTRAQNEYNRAVKEGAEWLQQLGFDAEDAALAQARAAIDLEDARQTLMRTQDQPMGSRARVEAELSFREAELNYRRSADRAKDLAKQREEADKKGLIGTEQVTGAQENLTEAERNLLKVQRDHAQAIAEIKSSANGANTAMSKLSKEAQRFVRYIASIRPELDKLKASAGRDLFPQLEKAIDNLVKNLFPALNPILRKTGDALGYFAVQLSKTLTLPQNIDIIKRVFGETNVQVIRNFGDAFANVTQGMLYVLDAARPITLELSEWAKNSSATWAALKGVENTTGTLSIKFQTAAEYFKQIKTVLGQVAGGIGALGKAAAPSGLMILKAFGGAFEKLENYAKSREGVATLGYQFEQIGKNVIAIGGFLTDLLKLLFRMGADPAVERFFTRLRNEGVPAFEKMVAAFSEASPFVEEFVIQFIKMIATFTESGGIENFFKILGKALEVVNSIFSNETVQKVFLFLAALKGVTLALGTLATVGGFVFKSLVGNLLVIPNALAKIPVILAVVKQQFAMFTYAVGLGAGPVLAIAAAIAAVIAVLVMAYKKSEKFREAVSLLIDAVKGALMGAFKDIKAAIESILPTVGGFGDTFKKIGDFLADYIVPVVGVMLTGAIGSIGGAIQTVIYALGALKDTFAFVFNVIKGIFQLFIAAFTGNWSAAFKSFKDAGMNLVSVLKNLLKAIAAPFTGLINGIVDGWNNSIGKLRWTIPDWVPKLGGKTISGPILKRINLASLAEGGIVLPQRGGTIAQIAEAGRPERVEPLDPDGLSRRDKAMIEMIIKKTASPSTTGPLVVVNPRANQSETEIGYIASREVAWALRRGGGF